MQQITRSEEKKSIYPTDKNVNKYLQKRYDIPII